MIERFLRFVTRLAYGGWRRQEDEGRKAAAEAFRRMKGRRDAEFERLVLTGR